MSATVTPDSFASCRSLARLNWIIDTTTQPDALTSARIRAVSTTVKRPRLGIASYLLDDFSAHSRFHLSATARRRSTEPISKRGTVECGSRRTAPEEYQKASADFTQSRRKADGRS